MRKNLDKDAVALLAVVAAVAWGTWLFARQRLELDAEWTDGTQRYTQTGGSGIRHAIWDDAEVLRGGLNSEGSERRPTLSPDGKLVVFASGERGLNAELWVADVAGDETFEPRPLVRLNTASDELAPAFGADALYFASDRGGAAFGLDLWRVPYANGVFGTAESLGPGINTEADETDPAPLGDDLVFASNRTRGARVDFDLFGAQLRDGRSEVAALDALNTPFDERDPAFATGGKALYFASNRSGGLGGFDLLRSFDEGLGWLPPQPLAGLNTVNDERGPAPSRDGFSLFFDAAKNGAPDHGAPDLWRARSRELFRVPPPPVGMREIFVLCVLVLLALVAWLAKRWRGVAVLYRCFLASILVHLAMLWFLRDVTPDAPPVVASQGEQLFHVRLAQAPSEARSALEARDGKLQAERDRPAETAAPSRTQAERAAAATSAVPEVARVAASSEEVAAAPARDESSVSPAKSAATEAGAVREVNEQFAAHAGARGELALSTSQLDVGHQSAAKRSTGRQRAARAEAVATLAPLDGSVRAERDSHDRAAANQAQRTSLREPAMVAAAADHAVRTPGDSEARAQHTGECPALSMPGVVAFEGPALAERHATRHSTGASSALAGSDGPASSPDANDLQALLATKSPERVARAGGAPKRFGAGVALDVQVGAPAQVQAVASAGAARGLELGAAAAFGFPVRSGSGPQRRAVSGAARTSSALDQDANPGSAAIAAEPSANEQPHAPAREVQLDRRAVHEAPTELAHTAGEDTSRDSQPKSPGAKTFDAALGMASVAMNSRAKATGQGPRRVGAKSTLAPDARPSAIGIEAAEAPAHEHVAAATSALEDTAYKNRFGDEKLRALEEFGGSQETEAAVALGLQYLASVQRSDGSFGDEDDYDRRKYGDVRIGKTGLALLAFLGAGNFPGSGAKHAANARNAVEFLVQTQHAESGHFGNGSAYGHGIATYALAECYALSGDAELVPPLRLAVEHILNEQQHSTDKRTNGGWGYYFADGHVWDRDRWPRASVSVWQLMALESAQLGGLEIPSAAFRDAGLFLANTWDSRRGAFRYSNDPERLRSGYAILPASTPAALFGLSLLGVNISGDNMEAARGFVIDRAPRSYRRASERNFVLEAKGNLYFWYYGTLAMFRAGGDDWKRWNVAMKDTLTSGQAQDGSWQPISTYAEYAGDDSRDKSYTTAINVLTLEVYYRYFTPLLKVR